MINRREFAGNLLKVMAGSVVATPAILKSLQAQTRLPIADLRRSLPAADGLIVIPGDAGFAGYQTSFNKRTIQVPEVRVLCKSAKGIATVIGWARENNVSFATRGGGHCYEGFSQSLQLVIDTRLMTDFRWEGDSAFSVGSGARLGYVYEKLSAKSQAIPAGSCPTVGIAGHSLGGGYGFLARPLGLACDSFRSVEIVTADGRIRIASESENTDLFWALKGGGNGSFGVVSKFSIRSHPVKSVAIYSANWTLPIERAAKVFDAWQSWAPNAPNTITSTMSVSKSRSGAIRLHSAGQSTGRESDLKEQLRSWSSKVSPSSPFQIRTMRFIDAVHHFGPSDEYPSFYIKGRSDYLKARMSEEGIRTLMTEIRKLSPGAIAAICDAYGGNVGEIAPDATAFAHRDALYSIQYYSQWTQAKDTPRRMAMSNQVYQTMRPYVSGFAYVNYPDLELPDYARAYWGDNLARLRQIKLKYDPRNIFRHGQSVPVGPVLG